MKAKTLDSGMGQSAKHPSLYRWSYCVPPKLSFQVCDSFLLVEHYSRETSPSPSLIQLSKLLYSMYILFWKKKNIYIYRYINNMLCFEDFNLIELYEFSFVILSEFGLFFRLWFVNCDHQSLGLVLRFWYVFMRNFLWCS